jgi:hypothetical protein
MTRMIPSQRCPRMIRMIPRMMRTAPMPTSCLLSR